ncbi:MAG TPA: hypothetical protein VLC46_07900 [Thermoanaerobaculia bacterium]|nr:hypothetical protein [Thermoanaerobaculia bacterium]
MDATAVLSISNWILAELVRVFHGLSIDDAQKLVDSLIERRTPIVWEVGGVKRVLRADMSLQDQILVLLATNSVPVKLSALLNWTEYRDEGYFKRVLRKLHSARLLEFNEVLMTLELLPPASGRVAALVSAGTSPKRSNSVKGRKRHS